MNKKDKDEIKEFEKIIGTEEFKKCIKNEFNKPLTIYTKKPLCDFCKDCPLLYCNVKHSCYLDETEYNCMFEYMLKIAAAYDNYIKNTNK